MFHYTVQTDKNVETMIHELEQSLKNEQFGVLWHFDIRKKLQEKGLNFDQQYHVLEVCNPKEAERVLSQNKLVGYFLPCKIVVYEENGKTKIGMPKPSSLIAMVEDDALKSLASDIEERLINCINQSI